MPDYLNVAFGGQPFNLLDGLAFHVGVRQMNPKDLAGAVEEDLQYRFAAIERYHVVKFFLLCVVICHWRVQFDVM